MGEGAGGGGTTHAGEILMPEPGMYGYIYISISIYTKYNTTNRRAL